MALLLAGCAAANKTDTIEAVKAGVIKDVSKGLNVASMDVTVGSVTFRGNEADASVSFAPKGVAVPKDQLVTMNYVMEKKEGEWHIKSRASGHAGAAQGGMSGMPGGHAGGTETGADPGMGGGTAMPPGHPPVTPGAGGGGMPSSEAVGAMPNPSAPKK